MGHDGTTTSRYVDQSKSVELLSHDRWINNGVITKAANENIPHLLISEMADDGAHWVRQDVKLKHEADGLQVVIRIVGGSANGLRVRLAFGSENASKSCWVSLDQNKIVKTDFSNTEIFSAGPDGGLTLAFAEKIDKEIDVVNIGIMLSDEDNAANYVGRGRQLRLGNCFVTFSRSAFDRVRHSREKPFGRTAYKLCKGRGVEIGALHKPFDLEAQVTYLDYEKTEVLRRQYRADAAVDTIGQVQVVWRGNFYPFFDDNAFDFVINSHVIEHTCNPGRMIEEWLRLIRPAGILYMVIPDKRFTFDRPRKLTTIDHMIEEYKSKVETIALEHYEDYILNGEKKYDTDEKFIKNCYETQSSIHVHTFTSESVLEFMKALQYFVSFEICHFEADAMHIHIALRKS